MSRANRTGEVINKLRVAIFRLDGITQIGMLSLPSSAPTYPMNVNLYNTTTNEPFFAEFWKKGHTTKKLFYMEVAIDN